MKYDKLKKVVNAFTSALKDDVTLVHLTIDGVSQKRLLKYVRKEASIECDPETEYKCVLTCYDNLLQQNVTFRMRDVTMYQVPTLELIETMNDIVSDDNGIDIDEEGEEVRPVPRLIEAYRFIYGDDYSYMWLKQQYGFDFDSDHKDLNEVRDRWVNILREFRNSALLMLDKERELAKDDDDQEAVDEIEMICQMLRDLPKNERDKLNKYTSVNSIMSHWPPLLLPAPDFVK